MSMSIIDPIISALRPYALRQDLTLSRRVVDEPNHKMTTKGDTKIMLYKIRYPNPDQKVV